MAWHPAPRFQDFYPTPPLPRTSSRRYNRDFRQGIGRAWTMGEPRWFYRTDEEWTAIAERLKQTPCPHCRFVGALIRHGYLRGYDETSPQRTTVRARRILCSNRNTRRGCGRTFSVWLADKIRRLSLTTRCLWQFLQRAVAGSVGAAIRATHCHLSHRTWQRLWKRFDRGQSQIRTALLGWCRPPPELATASRHAAVAQVLAHLQAAFPDADCPIAAFQHSLRIFIL